MNVSGKSLQDIFDEGSKRLEELAHNQKTTLSGAAEAHLDERATFEPEALKRLEERAGELEVLIRNHLVSGLDRIEKVISSEVTENEKYIVRLVENLVLLSRKFSESTDQLKQVSEFNLKNISADCRTSFSCHSERVASELKKEGALAIGDYQSEAAGASEHMARVIDESLLSSCNYVNDTGNKLFAAFEKHIGSVKTTMADHEAQLNEDYEKWGLELDGRLEQARHSIETHLEQILTDAQKHASDAGAHLKEIFANLLSGSTSAFDGTAERATQELSSLHESSMADLSMKTQELSRDMDSLSADVKQGVEQRDVAARDKGKALMEAYTEELNERLESSKVFHKDLEAERAQLVGEIWKELTDVQTKFEEKLSGLAQSTLEKLRTICSEAEGAIVSAQQVCISESKSNALTRQDGIQAASSEFLTKVQAKSKAALDGIRGAGGSGSDGQEQAKRANEKVETGSAEADSGKRKSEESKRQGKKSQAKRGAGQSQETTAADGNEGGSADRGSMSEDSDRNQGDQEDEKTNPRPDSDSKRRRKALDAKNAKDAAEDARP